jgi:hypothetical protein
VAPFKSSVSEILLLGSSWSMYLIQPIPYLLDIKWVHDELLQCIGTCLGSVSLFSSGVSQLFTCSTSITQTGHDRGKPATLRVSGSRGCVGLRVISRSLLFATRTPVAQRRVTTKSNARRCIDGKDDGTRHPFAADTSFMDMQSASCQQTGALAHRHGARCAGCTSRQHHRPDVGCGASRCRTALSFDDAW